MKDFNPRSRVGNDDTPETASGVPYGFQSTFPRGERPGLFVPVSTSGLFQSTFPRGERQIGALEEELAKCISIHVPAWGTTKTEV